MENDREQERGKSVMEKKYLFMTGIAVSAALWCRQRNKKYSLAAGYPLLNKFIILYLFLNFLTICSFYCVCQIRFPLYLWYIRNIYRQFRHSVLSAWHLFSNIYIYNICIVFSLNMHTSPMHPNHFFRTFQTDSAAFNLCAC